MEEELACQNMEVQLEALTDCEVAKYKDNRIFQVIEELRDTSNPLRANALQRFLSIGEWFYEKACQLEEKIHCFETGIRRPYFHVKPLELSELENWHQYLDFIEMHGDFDWVLLPLIFLLLILTSLLFFLSKICFLLMVGRKTLWEMLNSMC